MLLYIAGRWQSIEVNIRDGSWLRLIQAGHPLRARQMQRLWVSGRRSMWVDQSNFNVSMCVQVSVYTQINYLSLDGVTFFHLPSLWPCHERTTPSLQKKQPKETHGKSARMLDRQRYANAAFFQL